MHPINILYIHGYGSGENSITGNEIQRKLGDKANVFMPRFSNELHLFENMEWNIRKAEAFVKDNGINLVIGSSMGGFTAMQLSGVPRILINPCMKPSEIFATGVLGEISEPEIGKYRALEARAMLEDEKQLTYSLFATDDELFSYKELFEANYDPSKSVSTPGKHVISPKNIRESLLPLIERVIKEQH